MEFIYFVFLKRHPILLLTFPIYLFTMILVELLKETESPRHRR